MTSRARSARYSTGLVAALAALAVSAGCEQLREDVEGRAVPGATPVLGAAAFAPATPERGRAAIGAYGCGACHVIPGLARATGLVGPPLDAWSYRTVIAGEVPNTPENLLRWIMDPQAVEPGTAMPDLGVTEADARAIGAYLATLR